MEIIVTIAVLALAGYWIYDMSRKKENKTDDAKLWPYGEKLHEGKIHVKPAELTGSENRVEVPAPKATVEVSAESMKEELKNPLEVAVEQLAAKKPAGKKSPAKKTADKKPAVKKSPAKKKST